MLLGVENYQISLEGSSLPDNAEEAGYRLFLALQMLIGEDDLEEICDVVNMTKVDNIF